MKLKIKENKVLIWDLITLFVIIAVLIASPSKKIFQSEEINELAIYINNNEDTDEKVEITERDILEEFFLKYDDTIKFLSKTFQIDYEVFLSLLKENYIRLELLDTDRVEYTLISYLFTLNDTDSSLFNKNRRVEEANKDYTIALIKYFTNIYTDVDFALAVSIVEVESGFRASSMVNANNLFGGLTSNHNLITYRTPEYGILSYIKLLNDSYYGIGLNTVESIGRKYNPVYTNGVKVASPTWVANVSSAIPKYSDYSVLVDASMLLNFEKLTVK